MIQDKPFILYSLPKSRTTQQLFDGRKVEKAWNNICNFLINCTTTKPEQPTQILLSAYTAFEGDPNPEIADKIIQEAIRQFGEGKTEPIGYSYPSGIPHNQTKIEWNIDKNDLNKTIEYLIKGQPWPKFTIGPVELLISYNFKLIDPTSKNILPNQEEQSRILIWLSRNCVCTPDLYFPFEQADKNFKTTLEKLKHFFPFKLEEKYLRKGKLNKTKTDYIFTKIKSE